jgi:hypothetical protein
MVVGECSPDANSSTRHPNVKSEALDLPPLSLSHFQFQFPPHPNVQTTGTYPSLGPSANSNYLDSSGAYALVNDPMGGRFESPGSTDSGQSPFSPGQLAKAASGFSMDTVHEIMPFRDDYDEVPDIVGESDCFEATAQDPSAHTSLSHQRTVRRRSSKGTCHRFRSTDADLMLFFSISLQLATNVVGPNVNVNR